MKKILFSFFKTRQGQSVIEYSAIAALVMAGILVMGPHVVRSINAYFMSAEEQAQDSFREEIRQTPLTEEERRYPLNDCDCRPGTPVCGDDQYCLRIQLMTPWICTPSTCQALADGLVPCTAESMAGRRTWSQCASDGESLAYPTLIYPIGNEGYNEWVYDKKCGYRCCLDAELAEATCYYLSEPPELAGGYVRMRRLCGPEANIPQDFFLRSPDCGYRCAQKDDKARWCDDLSTSNIPSSLHDTVTHVDYGECSSNPDQNKCKAECPPELTAGPMGCTETQYCVEVELRPSNIACRKGRSQQPSWVNTICFSGSDLEGYSQMLIVSDLSARKDCFCRRALYPVSVNNFISAANSGIRLSLSATPTVYPQGWAPPGATFIRNLPDRINSPICSKGYGSYFNVKLYFQ